MSDPRFVDGAELHRLLSMPQAIESLDAAFGGELPESPPRTHLNVGSGDLLLMPAWSPDSMGVKLVTVAPDNPQRELPLIHGIYVLFDKLTLRPLALFDAAALTALRTAAVSGVATRHLARQDATRLVLFGAGTQGRAHLEAMVAVRSIETVAVISRSSAPAEDLAQRARALGLEARVTSADAVEDADLICTCTTSAAPLFDGALLKRGTHVNAVGSYTRTARELDDAAVARSSIYVDVDMALRESGDLVGPLESGALEAAQVGYLADVAAGRAGRESDSERTIFKSVGAAFEDLIVASAAAARL